MLHLVLTLAILTVWVQQQKFEITHMVPVWFIPVVGNILVPLAGVIHAPQEVSWFFFSGAWCSGWSCRPCSSTASSSITPCRRALPTFFILLAPPAVGFVAYVKLNGDVDNFAFVLYYFGLFLFLFLLVQIPMLRRARFYLSWWAYSFPVAAITIASMLMYRQTDVRFFYILAWVVFVLLVWSRPVPWRF